MTGPETPGEFTEWDESGEEITDRSNPVVSDSGRVPDHTATAEAGSDNSPSEPAPRRPRPWDSITPRSGAKRATGRMNPAGAPSKAKANASTGSNGENVPSLPRNFEGQLKDMYVTLGTMILPFDGVCGNAIVQAAPKCANTLVEYAKTNADVRRVLLRLVGTSAVGAIIAAHTPIIMAIAAHHVAPLFNRSADTDAFPVQDDPAVNPYLSAVQDGDDGSGWAGSARPRSRGFGGPRPDFGAV